jgi:hypothetical protein
MAINNLKSAHLVIAFAWATHALSWFLPVVKLGGIGGELNRDSVRGWVAFRAALSPILPYQDFHTDAWYYSVLSVASAATTFLFVVGSPLVVWRGSRSVRRACAWVAITAFIVNSHWYVLASDSGRKDLSIGYFLWWLSFILLAVGLFWLSSNNVVNQDRQATQTEAQEPT